MPCLVEFQAIMNKLVTCGDILGLRITDLSNTTVKLYYYTEQALKRYKANLRLSSIGAPSTVAD